MNSAKLHENPFIYGPSVAIFNNCMGPSPKLPMGYKRRPNLAYTIHTWSNKNQRRRRWRRLERERRGEERRERGGEVEEARARWRRRWGGSNPPSLTRRRGRCICFSAQSPSHLILFLHQSFPLSFGFVCGTNRLETFVFSSFTFLDADAVKVWFWRGISVLRYVLGVSANRGSDDIDEP